MLIKDTWLSREESAENISKSVSITKSYQRIKGEDVITKPKSKKSVRVIKMPEMVAIKMQDFINSIYGIEPSDRIFVLSKSYLHHEMDRGVKASGVKRIRIHDLRHSHACRSKGHFEAVSFFLFINQVNVLHT